MSPSIATFGAGALLIATSLFPAPVTADIHHSVHRIHRRHFRRSGLPSGWSTRGCITDSEASRVLSAHQTDTTLTTASCIKVRPNFPLLLSLTPPSRVRPVATSSLAPSLAKSAGAAVRSTQLSPATRLPAAATCRVPVMPLRHAEGTTA